MPSTSRDTASDAVTFAGVDIRLEHLDGEEVYEAGEAYYVRPGHTVVHHAALDASHA